MDRDLDVSLLRTFVTIAMTGSFTAAGNRLFRTQPAISLRIKRLEQAVGCPLIVRSTDRISLTREGNLLLGYAKRMLSLNDEVLARRRGNAALEEVRIGLPEEYTALAIETALKAFTADFPATSIVVEVRPSEDLRTRLDQGLLDLVVMTSLEGPGNRDLGRPLPVVWVGAEPPPPAMTDGLRLILPAEGNLYRQMALSALMTTEAAWTIVCTTSSWPATRGAVLAGLGITLASPDMLSQGMRPLGHEAGLPPLPTMRIFPVSHDRRRTPAILGLHALLERQLAGPRPLETGAAEMP